MKQFFYLDSDMKQHGPCSIDELRGTGITPSTKVWCAGMADWDDAGNVPELDALFRAEAPPAAVPGRVYSAPQPPQQPQAPSEKPDSWLPWAIIATILCCWPLGIPAIVYAAKVDNLWRDGQYDEAVRAARNAKQWTIASIVSGAAIIFIYLIGMAFGFLTNIFTNL